MCTRPEAAPLVAQGDVVDAVRQRPALLQERLRLHHQRLDDDRHRHPLAQRPARVAAQPAAAKPCRQRSPPGELSPASAPSDPWRPRTGQSGWCTGRGCPCPRCRRTAPSGPPGRRRSRPCPAPPRCSPPWALRGAATRRSAPANPAPGQRARGPHHTTRATHAPWSMGRLRRSVRTRSPKCSRKRGTWLSRMSRRASASCLMAISMSRYGWSARTS